MKILVCGGREFRDVECVYRELDEVTHDKNADDVIIIHGRANGADKLAGAYAECRSYSVDVLVYGPWPAAGCRRNQRMLDAEHVPGCQVDVVVAFPGGRGPGGRGTADMVRRARRAEITVLLVP